MAVLGPEQFHFRRSYTHEVGRLHHNINMPMQCKYFSKFEMFQSNLFYSFAFKTHISDYTLEPPRPDSSKEYPQSMFGSKLRKNVYHCNHPLFYIMWGIRWYSLHGHTIVMLTLISFLSVLILISYSSLSMNIDGIH